MFIEAQDSQTRAVGLFGAGSALDDSLNQSSGVRAGLFGPADESGGTPFGIGLVRRWHMFFDRGVLMGHKATGMVGHALAFAEGLHGVGRKPDFESFALQFTRHAVVVLVDFDMVVDADGGDLPLGVLVGLLREGRGVGVSAGGKEV